MENALNVKFAVIADPHYYSNKLGTEGKAYERRSGSDQKMLAETPGIVKAALNEVLRSDAEFLLIAGDLSNDGERCSHEEIRELLYEFKKHKPVYVITATHDWCCDGNPRRFEGDCIFHDVDTVPVDELRDFYRDFGPGEAVSEFFTHQKNSSYIVRPCGGVSVFCLNDDQNGSGGSGYSDEHFAWISEQAAKARERGDAVFGMQHHHMFTTEFQKVINGKGSVENKQTMARMFADAGLPLMFTGHSHMQSIRRVTSEKGNCFYEVNVGSISGYPAPICYCTLTADGVDIHTAHLEKFTYNGVDYGAKAFEDHATALFRNVLDAAVTNEKERFEALLEAVDVTHEKADKIWIAARPVLKKLSKMTVGEAARLFNFISFGKAVDKTAAKEVGKIKLTDVIFETFNSILDGSLKKHERGSAYYTVFTDALAFPLKAVKKLHIKNDDLTRRLTHLSAAADELMTGGPLDNNNYFIRF